MKGQRIRPAAPLAATCARLMYLTLTLALLARLPLAINASPTVAAYTVGPNNADFPTLPAAWAVLVAQQTDAILRLANGVHPIPPDSVTLLDASSATRPFTISHVPVAPAVGGGGVGGVLISPGQPTQPQEYLGASSLVTLSGPVVLAFSNITFAGFACVDRTFNSPWAVVALYGTSQLVLTDVTIRDNGAINAVFALAAQDSAFVTLERVAMVADSAHSIEFLSMGSAAISVFDSRIEGVSAWRDTVFDAYNAAAVTVVRTVFTRTLFNL
ncbi:hypothetical protein BC828DRAFT_178741 [Blastocladiella britannica]|nr:hypothetical protein BC828DRAFT_178741 [Blastocladiella britannica]